MLNDSQIVAISFDVGHLEEREEDLILNKLSLEPFTDEVVLNVFCIGPSSGGCPEF